MKTELLKYLCDPYGDNAEFELIDIVLGDNDEIETGTLVSSYGNYYPIINGIPRILSDDFLISLSPVSEDWIKKYKPNMNVPIITLQVEVAKSFESEWKKFSNITEEFRNIFNNYFNLWQEKKTFGNNVLDAGCGMGRWAYYSSKKAGKLFCVDISQAIDVAKNNVNSDNSYFVQADLTKLPFKNNIFDAAYSLGVLHHIPDTLSALKELKNKIVDGGDLLTYFYYSLDNRPLYFKFLFHISNLVRNFVSRLPKKLAHMISWILAVIVYMPFIQIGKLFNLIGLTKVAKQIPLYEGYKNANFYIIYNDSVDRFTTPLEKRYSKEEIIGMYEKLNFKDIQVQNDIPYWVTNGIKSHS